MEHFKIPINKKEDALETPPVIPQSVKEYFAENTSTSREILVLKKFINYIELKNITLDFTDTPENIDLIKTFLEENRVTKQFIKGVSFDGIIEELRISGLLIQPEKEIIIKEVIPPERIETGYIQLGGLKESELYIDDTELEKNIETSKTTSFSRKGVEKLGEQFKDRETTKWEYYNEFVLAGLISEEDAKNDFIKIQDAKLKFNKGENLTEKDKERLDFAKQIAIVTEKGIEFLINKIQIFGKDIAIKTSSEFTDILRGVDSIIEITKDDGDMDFVGVAADVTFRRMKEISFKEKFYSVLKTIKRDWKTRVKYEKNSKGELMKEFVVPKVLLHFNMDDVRLCVDVLDKSTRNSDEELKNKFEEVKQKNRYLQQIILQCELLSEYAKENKNSIFRQYDTVLNSITELSWRNPEVKEALQDEVPEDMKSVLVEIIKDFDSDPKNWS